MRVKTKLYKGIKRRFENSFTGSSALPDTTSDFNVVADADKLSYNLIEFCAPI